MTFLREGAKEKSIDYWLVTKQSWKATLLFVTCNMDINQDLADPSCLQTCLTYPCTLLLLNKDTSSLVGLVEKVVITCCHKTHQSAKIKGWAMEGVGGQCHDFESACFSSSSICSCNEFSSSL